MAEMWSIISVFFSALPTPIFYLTSLVVFVGILVCLLKLIKLILDAIPFV